MNDAYFITQQHHCVSPSKKLRKSFSNTNPSSLIFDSKYSSHYPVPSKPLPNPPKHRVSLNSPSNSLSTHQKLLPIHVLSQPSVGTPQNYLSPNRPLPKVPRPQTMKYPKEKQIQSTPTRGNSTLSTYEKETIQKHNQNHLLDSPQVDYHKPHIKRDKKAYSVIEPSGVYLFGSSPRAKIVEKEFLSVNAKEKLVVITKDMISVEDSTEIRHFLKTAEESIQTTFHDIQPFNYVQSPIIYGIVKPPTRITINAVLNNFKTCLECLSTNTIADVKRMIEIGICTQTPTSKQVNYDDYRMVIVGTRQFLMDNEELRRYSYVNDLIYRDKILNIELIQNTVLQETFKPPLLRHSQLLEMKKIKCRSSLDSDEYLSFTITELLNFDPTIIYEKFFEPSDIPQCLKIFFETRSFEKHRISLKFTSVLYMGSEQLINKSYETSPFSSTTTFTRIITDFKHHNLPLEARLGLTLTATRRSRNVVIGYSNIPIFDFQHFLLNGDVILRLWPDASSTAVSTCLQNPSPTAIHVNIHFPTPAIKICYFTRTPSRPTIPPNLLPTTSTVASLAIANDPFAPLPPSQREIVWQNRYNILTQFPNALDLLLRAVPWTSASARVEMADLLVTWPGLSAADALGLLDARNTFEPARRYAVRILEDAKDEVILRFLPQFIQVLKFESYACSPLALMLLKKAIRCRGMFGQMFYWLLVGENVGSMLSLRFKLLLESYCQCCGKQIMELKTQENLIKILEELASKAKEIDFDVQSLLPPLLNVVNLAVGKSCLTLPFTSRQTVAGVNINHCKVFDSNAHPILLSFQSSTLFPDIETRFIFKVGDNLMQDMLTLQMFHLMDDLWKKNGYDFRLTLYNVLPTSSNSGIIQFVPNSETVNHIQTESNGVTGVFDDACIYEWLKQHNPKKENLDAAIENFTYSCAGYCVATYVIGVGDRHNDNIMVSKDGHLFHIDFGYFLGNVIKLGFYSKESAPFVLTNDFVYVITAGDEDSEKYKKFEELCCAAFMVLRNNAKTFIYLFMMMLCGGIPQLKDVKDVQYIKDVFQLDKTDDEAEEHFLLLIRQSIKTFRTRLNFFMHSIVH
ncbi:Phosphatidylinositol 3-kinase catalytic subunit gamma [Entamoeba marina]